jgi:hypothetical protein
MNLISIILSVAIIGILAVSLIVTFAAARHQRVVEGEFDSKIAKPVQKNIYTRNPVFLAYAIFFALLLFIILFVAMNFY